MPYLGNFVGGIGSSSESSFSLLSIDDGSESAPSIAYKDDANLGIYSPAQDTLGFVTNGSEALRIDSNGRIGIGTDNPGSLIDIYGDGPDTTQISLRQWNDNSSNVQDGPDIRFFASGGTIASPAEPDDNDVLGKVNAWVNTGSSYNQYGGFGWRYRHDPEAPQTDRASSFAIETKSFTQSTNSSKINITQDGVVELYHIANKKLETTSTGIEVSGSVTQQSSSAVQPLINSTGAQSDLFFRCGNNAYSTIVFGDQTNTIRKGIRYDSATDKLEFKGAGMSSTHLTVDSSGNVGIGETSPSYKLHVSGDIKLADTGTIWFDDTTNSIQKIVGTGSTLDLYADAEVRFFESDANLEKISIDVNNARIFFNGDDNTYWHRPASDTHAFVNNGSTSLYINSDGEVGIGTESPETSLHIKDGTASPMITLENPNDNTGTRATYIRSKFDDGFGGEILCLRQSGDAATDAEIAFRVGGLNVANQKMVIKSSGNVGIGDTDPDNLLTINTDANGEGVTLRTTGSSFNSLKSYSNRTGSDLHILALQSYWDNTEVTRIASESGSDTTDKDDGRISFWTKTSGSALAERVRIETNGYVGIGGDFSTIAIRNKLHITGGDMNLDNNKYIGFNIYNDGSWKQVGSGNGAVIKHHNTDGLQLYTGPDSGNGGGGAASVSARLTIDNSGNVGIGTTSPSQKLNVNGGSLLVNGGTVTGNNTYAGRFDLTVDNVNADMVYGLRTVTTMNNTGTTSSDREQGAIYNLITDNSIGAADHEHRLWTVWNDINVYGHADLAYGTYNDLRCYSPSSVPAFAHLRGTYNLVQVQQNTDNTSAQYNNVWGSYNIAQPASSYNGTIGTLGGVYGRANFGSSTTTSVSNVYAVLAEIDNDAGSTTTVTGRSALFYGHYVRTGETQFGYLNDPYGILIEDDVRSYHRGAFGIGPSSRDPATELHVSGDAATIRLHDTDTSLSDNELSSGIQFYQSDTTGAGISSAIYVEGSGSTGKTSINFYTGGPGHSLFSMGHSYSVGDTYTDDNGVDYQVITVPDPFEFIVEDGPGAPTDSNYSVVTNLQRKVIIDANGRVGIFKEAPATALDVAGTITLTNSTQENAIRTNSSGQLEILRNAASNNNVSVTIDDLAGNIGIGTTTITERVNINGSVNIHGGVISSYLTPVINDDSSDTVTLPVKGGLIAITSFTTYDTYPQPTGTGIVYFDSGTSRNCSIMSSADATGNGALVASTSTSSDIANFTDNRTTVSAINTTGMIRIINRSGSNRQYKVTLL